MPVNYYIFLSLTLFVIGIVGVLTRRNAIILLIPLLPFIGFLINGLGRRFLPKGVVSIIGCGTVLISFVISLMVFFQKQYSAEAIHYFDFINTGSLKVPFAFQIDQLSTIFL